MVSVVSLWEMTIKSSKGSLDLPGGNINIMIQALQDYSYDILELAAADMDYLQGLPRLHKDPFDRMIVAQAKRHSLALVTVDAVLKQYGVPVLWN